MTESSRVSRERGRPQVGKRWLALGLTAKLDSRCATILRTKNKTQNFIKTAKFHQGDAYCGTV